MTEPLLRPLTSGYVPSPPDPRDYAWPAANPLAADRRSVPTRFRIDPVSPLPVYDQGFEPSCVGWAAAAVKTAMERRDARRTIRFDGSAIYRPIALPGGGAYVRDALKALTAGAATDERGRPYPISGYAAVPLEPGAVRRALLSHGALIGGFSVPRWFLGAGGKEFDAGSGNPDDLVGAHGIAVTGYDPAGVLLHNSWSESWGHRGRLTVPWDFLPRFFFELWAAFDVDEPPRRVRRPSGSEAAVVAVANPPGVPHEEAARTKTAELETAGVR